MRYTDKQIIKIPLSGMTAVYTVSGGVMSFTCVPNQTVGDIRESKLFKEFNKKYPCREIEPMAQVARLGDSPRRDFSAGVTMYDRATAFLLRVYDQKVTETATDTTVVTFLKTDDELYVRHVLTQRKGYAAASLHLEIENKGNDTVLELASSFAISALTPFAEENDPEKLILHRLQSNWSGEGRKESTPVSAFNFEDSWSSLGIRLQRIGALGSMPARGYLPFTALEDVEHGVTWAVQVEAPSSWQLETLHRYGGITLTGGQADYLYGHWRKTLKSGETFVTHNAYFTAVQGGLTKACAALTKYHDTLYRFPRSEQTLPIIYNEYLYSWGDPRIENVRPQLQTARALGAEYFVLDAGWFCGNNAELLGDWNVVPEKFPNGLKEFSDEAARAGFTAGGVWFEFEAVTDNAELAARTDWLLHCDGLTVNHQGRLFLDFRKGAVDNYLTDKVIRTLRENKLNYVKIDYNENIGFGVDGAESPGEGLREHIERVVAFYKKLRDALPDLVIEVCSSGGMRHEPLFSTLGSMVSFSDAHENPDGAVVAMDLHRVMQPRTMQVWASILPDHSVDEVYFTIAKAMLGRICLSGRLTEVSPAIKQIVRDGVDYYQTVKDIIQCGETVLIDTDEIRSLRNPKGLIRLMRVRDDGRRAVCYCFKYGTAARTATFSVPGFRFVSQYGTGKAAVSENILQVELGARPLAATVVLLEKE